MGAINEGIVEKGSRLRSVSLKLGVEISKPGKPRTQIKMGSRSCGIASRCMNSRPVQGMYRTG